MAYQLKRLSPKHDEILLYMMLSPGGTLTQMGKDLGYTVGWLSQIINCDLFQERLAQTRATAEVEIGWLSLRELQGAVAYQGLEKVRDKLDREEDLEKISDITVKLLKIISPKREDTPPQQTNTLIIATQEGLNMARKVTQAVQQRIPPLIPTDDLGRGEGGKVLDGSRVIDGRVVDADSTPTPPAG